jgi:hypothetical protein
MIDWNVTIPLKEPSEAFVVPRSTPGDSPSPARVELASVERIDECRGQTPHTWLAQDRVVCSRNLPGGHATGRQPFPSQVRRAAICEAERPSPKHGDSPVIRSRVIGPRHPQRPFEVRVGLCRHAPQAQPRAHVFRR